MACKKLCVYVCAASTDPPSIEKRFEQTCGEKDKCPEKYHDCPLVSETYIRDGGGAAVAAGAIGAGVGLAAGAKAGTAVGAIGGPLGALGGALIGAGIGWLIGKKLTECP